MNILILLLSRLWPLILVIVLLWLAYHAFFDKKKKKGKEKLPEWQAKLWFWTFILSIAAFLISVVVMVMQFQDNKNDQYVPAHIENGTIIPGHTVPHDE